MKKTSVNVYDFSVPDKNHVRLARQITLVKTISISHSMNNGPDQYFGFSVAIADTRHIEATLFS